MPQHQHGCGERLILQNAHSRIQPRAPQSKHVCGDGLILQNAHSTIPPRTPQSKHVCGWQVDSIKYTNTTVTQPVCRHRMCTAMLSLQHTRVVINSRDATWACARWQVDSTKHTHTIFIDQCAATWRYVPTGWLIFYTCPVTWIMLVVIGPFYKIQYGALHDSACFQIETTEIHFNVENIETLI
jgi:hypothetical protein